MKGRTTYSKTFKIEAVKKVLSRTSGTSMIAVARSLGVANTTLHGWVKAMENKDLREHPTSGGSNQKSPYNWTVKERFDAIIEASKLSQEEVFEYCRKKGIFPHHLDTWKKEFVEGSSKKNQLENNAEIKALKNENKKLASELRRKEKALAEAAALLVLKKKADAYWGTDEED